MKEKTSEELNKEIKKLANQKKNNLIIDFMSSDCNLNLTKKLNKMEKELTDIKENKER